MSEKQIEAAVNDYLQLIKKELTNVDEMIRDKIKTSTLLNMEETLRSIDESTKKLADKPELQEAVNELPLRPLHQIPPSPKEFTGRKKEIKELLNAVKKGGVAISGLRGMGGIGKTALALVIANELKRDYPDAHIYLNLLGTSREPLSSKEALTQVLRAFLPTEQLPESERELRALYLSVLRDKRALLLMDNAADAKQVNPLVPPEGSIMLLTSRQHFALQGVTLLRLGEMDSGEAEQLLLGIAPRIKEHAPKIAELCDYLPLALKLVASAIAVREDLPVKNYIDRLEKARLVTLDMAADLSEEESGIQASLKLSYDLLGRGVQRHWRALAVFPESFEVQGAAAVWELDKGEAREALGELLRYSLLEWSETTRRYKLHDLARLYADALLEGEEQGASQQHAEHYLKVLSAAHALYLEGGDHMVQGLRLYDLEVDNIQAGQAWTARNAKKTKHAAKLCTAYPHAAIYVLMLRLHAEERIEWLGSALTAARQIGDRSSEGKALGNLGNAYADLGKTQKAIEFYEKRLDIARQISDRRGEGNVLGNLGISYRHLGDIQKAIDYLKQSLSINREIGNRHGEGAMLGNLGNAYLDIGKTQLAIDQHKQALAINRELGDRRGEGHDLGNLGNAYAAIGKTQQAIDYYEQALSIRRETGDLRAEGVVLGNLGVAYAEIGETQQAINFHEKRLEIAQQIGDRRGEGIALCNVGIAYKNMGDIQQAINYHKKALKISREIGDGRVEALVNWNLGQVYIELGDLTKAIEVMQTLVDYEVELGHPDAEKDMAYVEGLRARLAEEG